MPTATIEQEQDIQLPMVPAHGDTVRVLLRPATGNIDACRWLDASVGSDVGHCLIADTPLPPDAGVRGQGVGHRTGGGYPGWAWAGRAITHGGDRTGCSDRTGTG